MKGEFFMLFSQREKGQGLVEYALIIILIAMVVILAMSYIGPTIGNVFNNIGATLGGA
jgi:pilus assembly protein Flp/PilA